MRSGNQNQTDQTANFFWMLVLAMIAGLAFWWFDQSAIVTFFFHFRGIEITLIKWFADAYTSMAQILHLPMPSLHQSLGQWQAYMAQHTDHKKVCNQSLQYR